MNDLLRIVLHGVSNGAVAGFPVGLMLGVLLGPARISGIDFRQWFWDPTQPSEMLDDSWIGLMRGAAHVLFGAAMLSLVSASLWLWLPRTCPPDHFTGLLYLLDDCLGFWVQWPLIGIILGIIAAQIVTELAWWTGLALLPLLPARARVLVHRTRHATGPRPAAAPTGRRLIVCCDGTWNWPDQTRETNVVRLVRAIKSEAVPTVAQAAQQATAPIPQIVHYHLGVGTGNFVDRMVGGGAGVGLSNSVKSCYGFLVDNYKPGDEILLFGFSRGAYVVRSVAGLISLVGILQKPEMERFIDVWDWYTDRGRRDPVELCCFAPNRHQNGNIQCIGVWDTVGALGIPGTRFCARAFAFHQTELGAGVRHAFQALAIDERRR
jgi:hypothetical protein